MSKTILSIESPVSQSVDAVKSLLAYMHRPSEPLPEFVELNDRVWLTLSKDGKAYYTTTTKSCSCPARFYHPGKICKHMKALQLSVEEKEDKSILPAMAQPFRPTSDDIPRLWSRPTQVAVKAEYDVVIGRISPMIEDLKEVAG